MDTSTLEFYYAAIAVIFVVSIYWFILRKGYILHVMQPLGNIGKQTQTIESNEDIKDAEGNVTGKESKKITVTGDAGIYQEIAKKKVSYAKAGQTINFFATKKELKFGSNINATGKSYLIDNSGVSYLHWRNRHIFLDSESMMPIKLQSGTFRPSSRLWYQLFDLGLLEKLNRATSQPPQKQKNSTMTLIIITVMAFAIGYFTAIAYGHILSPAFFPSQSTSTTISSVTNSITSTISSVITSVTTTVSNGTTITKVAAP